MEYESVKFDTQILVTIASNLVKCINAKTIFSTLPNASQHYIGTISRIAKLGNYESYISKELEKHDAYNVHAIEACKCGEV